MPSEADENKFLKIPMWGVKLIAGICVLIVVPWSIYMTNAVYSLGTQNALVLQRMENYGDVVAMLSKFQVLEKQVATNSTMLAAGDRFTRQEFETFIRPQLDTLGKRLDRMETMLEQLNQKR